MKLIKYPDRPGITLREALIQLNDTINEIHLDGGVKGVFGIVLGHHGHEAVVSWGARPKNLEEYGDE